MGALIEATCPLARLIEALMLTLEAEQLAP